MTKPEKKQIKQATLTKRMGLKSTLVFDNKITVTSFANSSNSEKASAHIEKRTDFWGKTIMQDEKMFRTDVEKQQIYIEKEFPDENNKIITQTAMFENPALRNCGKDYIGMKNSVEKVMFGKEFPNDNLHIQIAYNILDIKKIICPYINNVVNIFYNLGRGKLKDDKNDLLGNKIGLKSEEKIEDLLINSSAYFVYFGDVFKQVKLSKEQQEKSEEEKRRIWQELWNKNFDHNKNIVNSLIKLRQMCFHQNYENSDKEVSSTALFNIEQFLNKEEKASLDEIYTGAIDKVNYDFNKNSSNNLYILEQIYCNDKNLGQRYYDFVVKKSQCNLGLDTKLIRELLIRKLSDEGLDINDSRYDTYRNKIYTVFGFILYYELTKNETFCQEIVAKLRRFGGDEIEKNKIYNEYFLRKEAVYNQIAEKFKQSVCWFKKEKEKKKEFSSKTKIDLKSVQKIEDQNASVFAKMVYLISRFLDGKEINELCTKLLNKFKNINELAETAKRCGETIEFCPEYKMFKNSAKLAEEMRFVQSVSKMKKLTKKEDKSIKPQVIDDALELLGLKIEKYKKDDQGNFVLDDQNHKVWTDEYKSYRKECFTPKNSDSMNDAEKSFVAKGHQKRNFIISNVVLNKRFLYVAKYGSPTACNQMMKNQKIVRMALESISEDQLRKYARRVYDNKEHFQNQTADEIRENLAKKLKNFNIGAELKTVGNLSEKDFRSSKNTVKDKSKSLIGLYLTVAYLITKNMIKINTRFSIAFGAYERDMEFLLQQKKEKGKRFDWLALTQKFLSEDKNYYFEHDLRRKEINKISDRDERKKQHRENDKYYDSCMHFSRHSFEYISKNFAEVQSHPDPLKLFIKYRNNVMHLNIIRDLNDYLPDFKRGKAFEKTDTFYDLYCYCLQKMLLSEVDGFSAINENIDKYCTASKDFMNLLNIIFAYNVPRYKNLSNKELFYRLDSEQ